VGVVRTLDHHLPKAKYTVLAVTPNNLVPCCRDCQSSKECAFPTKAEEQTLHPYFDDVESETWVCADIVPTAPAAFQYYAAPPKHWGQLLRDRAAQHFKTFGLAQLYARNAGSHLAGIRTALRTVFDAGGTEALRKHLLEQAESWEVSSKNSWEAAMYRASAASDWFCDGGFAAT
jgi:hypothetical protein